MVWKLIRISIIIIVILMSFQRLIIYVSQRFCKKIWSSPSHACCIFANSTNSNFLSYPIDFRGFYSYNVYKRLIKQHVIVIFSVLVLCTQVNMMFVSRCGYTLRVTSQTSCYSKLDHLQLTCNDHRYAATVNSIVKIV